MITGILSIVLWLGIIPLGIGGILSAGFERKKSNIIQTYLFGLVIYLALFQAIIISNMLTINNFFEVCKHFF